MASMLPLALATTFLGYGPNSSSQTSHIEAVTGNSIDRVTLPGDPEALSVVVINNVADVMIKTKDVVGAGGGAYSSVPPDVVAKYGSAGHYNYGYKLNTDPVTRSANCTVEYSDSTTGASAFIVTFVLSLFELKRRCCTRPNSKLNPTQPNPTQRNPTQPNPAQPQP